jgi:chromosome segregation ATPase
MNKLSGDVRASQPTVEETLQAIDNASGSKSTQESVRLFSEDLTGRFETVSASVQAVVDTVNQLQGFARNVQLRNELNDSQRAFDQEVNKTRAELSRARVEIGLSKHRFERRDATILQLQESEQDLRVRLSKATRDLEQARPKLQQAEDDARDLEIVTTQLNVVRATVDDLRGKLAQAKRVHQDCPGKLAEVHERLGESVAVKRHIEQQHRNTLIELERLQSQEAQGLLQQSRDQQATERREFMAQLAELRSREAESFNSQLKKAWDAEKQALLARLADKDSLIELHKREADTLRMALAEANAELAIAREIRPFIQPLRSHSPSWSGSEDAERESRSSLQQSPETSSD